jgi:hypothetical protein
VKPETQEFLESLTEDDIKHIRKALKTFGIVETLGSFVKWMFLLLLAVAVSISQFGDSIKKIVDWVR